jgi:hypothetical protein
MGRPKRKRLFVADDWSGSSSGSSSRSRTRKISSSRTGRKSPPSKTTSRSDGGGRKPPPFVKAIPESKTQIEFMSSDESDDEIVTRKNIGLTFTKGGVNSNPGGCSHERQMPSGRKEHNDDDDDDDGDGGTEKETGSESEYNRKYAATNKASSRSKPSTKRSRDLLADCISALFAQLKALDMVRWTQQKWKKFSTDLRSLTSLVNDAFGCVPEFLLGANKIAMKWICIQVAIVPLRARLESSDPVMSSKESIELRYVTKGDHGSRCSSLGVELTNVLVFCLLPIKRRNP